MATASFADRIRERFPEGLTGIFAIGGTRTTYILEQNRHAANPGRIEDFAEHSRYLQDRYREFILSFYELGGQNMIITASSFRGFHERGAEYARLVAKELLALTNDAFVAFYREHNIDPYLVGIDAFLHLPEDSTPHQMAKQMVAFNKSWPYKEGRRKLIWEIASIPLYSFWQIFQNMSDEERTEINSELAALTNLEDIHRLFYNRISKLVYGTEVPMPHFYLGTNKSGDLKWRSPMPISLTGGEHMRMFYTPYPSLFTTPETFRAILEDLAFNERFHSLKTDYKDKYSPELVEAEYERVMGLRSDPDTTVGLSRKVIVDELKGRAKD